MLQYKVVTGPYVEALEPAVTAFLKAGWELHGGVSIGAHRENGWMYAQAIVRTVEDDSPKVRVTWKDPDYAVKIPRELDKEEIREWLPVGEYITVEFDVKTKTGKIVK